MTFTDLTPREVDLLEAIAKGWLTQDTDGRLTREDRRLLRKMYREGLITAEAHLEVDGPPHDLLTGVTEEGREVLDSLEEFRARVSRQGVEDFKAGRVKPWSQVRRELGLDSQEAEG